MAYLQDQVNFQIIKNSKFILIETSGDLYCSCNTLWESCLALPSVYLTCGNCSRFIRIEKSEFSIIVDSKIYYCDYCGDSANDLQILALNILNKWVHNKLIFT